MTAKLQPPQFAQSRHKAQQSSPGAFGCEDSRHRFDALRGGEFFEGASQEVLRAEHRRDHEYQAQRRGPAEPDKQRLLVHLVTCAAIMHGWQGPDEPVRAFGHNG